MPCTAHELFSAISGQHSPSLSDFLAELDWLSWSCSSGIVGLGGLVPPSDMLEHLLVRLPAAGPAGARRLQGGEPSLARSGDENSVEERTVSARRQISVNHCVAGVFFANASHAPVSRFSATLQQATSARCHAEKKKSPDPPAARPGGTSLLARLVAAPLGLVAAYRGHAVNEYRYS